MTCSNDQFIVNLIEVNKRAKVDPEIIELIAAYARLCLRYGKEVAFYDENPAPISNKAVKRLIERNPNLDKKNLSFLVSYAEMMQMRGLPFIFNVSHLAYFLGNKHNELLGLIKDKDAYYQRFYIPKSNGDRRLICAPRDGLKAMQRKILRNILERVPVHASVNGFKRERSILTNAKNHVDQEVVIKMDVKDFFPSITYERAKGVYISLGYPEGVAKALTELSTYKGRLPMGAPTSPCLSNIVATRLDKRFTNLGNKSAFRYTRYADDLAFSSKERDLTGYIPFFKKIIEDEGFEVNNEKIVIARKGGKQKITGVVVNKKINIDRGEYKRLRAVVHNCLNGDVKEEMKKWGASGPGEFKNTLLGHINFTKMLNSEKGGRLLEGFKKISWPV